MFSSFQRGGLSVPNLKFYNIASLLEPINVLWNDPSLQRWAKIENNACSTPSFQLHLIASILGNPMPRTNLLSLKHTALIWNKYIVKKDEIALSRNSVPLAVVQCWIPSFPTSTWLQAGVCNIGCLYTNDTMRSFSDLSSSFNIPRSKFFQFLQLRHLLNSWKWQRAPPHLSPFHKFLFKWKGYERGLSTIYKSFLDATIVDRPEYVVKWEAELLMSFPISSWTEAARAPLKLSRCVNHVQLMRKIHSRWYLTPVRLSHICPGYPTNCWRLCGEVGTLKHMWWECSVLLPLWASVEHLISEILHYPFTLTPEVAILDINLIDFPPCHRTLVHHILIAVRMTIAHHWKASYTPPFQEVLNRINSQFHCETQLVTPPHLVNKKLDYWSLWSTSSYVQ